MSGTFRRKMANKPLFVAIIVVYLAQALHVSGTVYSLAEFFLKFPERNLGFQFKSDRRRL